MSVEQSFENLKTHLEAEFASVKARIEQDLPEVGKFVADAASNPVTVALAAAVHLPEAPEYLQMVAEFITKIDAALGTAKAAGAAGASAPAEPDVPADPAPAPAV